MYRPEHEIRLRGSGRTDTGQLRDNNEDSIHLSIYDGQTGLAVVADGMGGAVAGEEASRIAVETVCQHLEDLLSLPRETDLHQDKPLIQRLKTAIEEANLNILAQANHHPKLKGMGTTITLALMHHNQAVLGHVGDSRAYLIDGMDGHIHQITSDHSFVQALVTAGHITEGEAEEHPMRNVLYRALGQANEIEVDLYLETLHSQDRLVLCSDGLTLHVRPHEIARIATDYDEPDAISDALIDLANKRGGRDNVSVVVLMFQADKPLDAITDSQTGDLGGNEDSQETFGPRENRDSGTLNAASPAANLAGGNATSDYASAGESDAPVTDPHPPAAGEGRDRSASEQ